MVIETITSNRHKITVVDEIRSNSISGEVTYPCNKDIVDAKKAELIAKIKEMAHEKSDRYS